MKYMGSKNRHAKELLNIILANRKEGQWYVEPFVGGFNVIDKVSGNRIGNDSHYYLIELFRAVQSGWQPPEIVTESEYLNIRLNKEKYSPNLVGFVGFGCSYSGKWFGGYARGSDSKGCPRNYALESKNNILKQFNGLQGIKIENKNYLDLQIPENSIIYCDPPYENTTKYKDDDIKLLNAWGAIAGSCCWWSPWEGICIISDRPRLVKFDDQKRLHNENDMAVKFSDGWGVYSWHGTRIDPSWILDKKNLKPETVLKTTNLEQRRAGCEIIGWVNILRQLNAKTIQKDDDPEIGELLEVDLPDSGKEKFLKVQCGTKRTFAIPVPPEMKTALQANAWTFGIDDWKNFKPEIRT